MNKSGHGVRRKGRLVKAGLALVATTSVLSVGTALPASAGSAYQVQWTGIGIYPRAGASMDSAKVGAALPDGATVTVACELEGQAVSNGYGTTTIWERLDDGRYLPNAFIDTKVDGWTPGVPRCDASTPTTTTPVPKYDGAAAAKWAVDNVDIPPVFEIPIPGLSGSDCTYFVSQAMWNGGRLPRTPDWTSASTDKNKLASRNIPWLNNPGPTKAAASADWFKNYMVDSGLGTIKEVSWTDNTAGGAQLGDIIGYDWDNGADGVLDHLAIVTKLNNQGYPYVTQHSTKRVNRYWSWSPDAHQWIADAMPGARVYLIHIYK